MSLKDLIIVESPTKAKTIKNFVGSNYEVIASKGHIRDLPKHSFGIKIDNQEFIPEYQIDESHKNIVNELKKLAKNSKTIYIATDEDREGEAIGFHIATAIGKERRESYLKLTSLNYRIKREVGSIIFRLEAGAKYDEINSMIAAIKF